MDIKQEIETVEKQLKSIETAYIKCMGTLEYLKHKKEESEKDKKEKSK